MPVLPESAANFALSHYSGCESASLSDRLLGQLVVADIHRRIIAVVFGE
jgi:hypothetical protein